LSEIISSDQKLFVINTISSQLPNAKLLAFGSRIRGDAKKYSDLDIAINLGKKIDSKDINILEENFAESDLPFKVDLVDYQRISDEFRKLVDKNAARWN